MGRTHKQVNKKCNNISQKRKDSTLNTLNLILSSQSPSKSIKKTKYFKNKTLNAPKGRTNYFSISTCSSSENDNTCPENDVKNSELKTPLYYLHNIRKSVIVNSNENFDYKRYLTHFNFLRKCFGIMQRLKYNYCPIQINIDEIDRKILVLDLDETLVHTYNKDAPPDALLLKVKLLNNNEKNIFVKVRPYCNEFLIEASKIFDLYIFTASHKSYADPVIDILDPKNTIFKGRLYLDSCKRIGKYVIKDLRIFNRDLRNIIMVDNTATCWGMQIENGVPIVCYRGQNEDSELRELMQFLRYLNNYSDVRKGIMHYFRWDIFANLYKDATALVGQYLN